AGGLGFVAGGGGVPDAVLPAEDQRLRAQIKAVERHARKQQPEFGGHGRIARPPLTVMVVPVEYEASSDSSQRMALATSSAVPARGMGNCAAMRSTRPGSPVEAWISVSITPGRTALTRMPSAATSSAR